MFDNVAFCYLFLKYNKNSCFFTNEGNFTVLISKNDNKKCRMLKKLHPVHFGRLMETSTKKMKKKNEGGLTWGAGMQCHVQKLVLITISKWHYSQKLMYV